MTHYDTFDTLVRSQHLKSEIRLQQQIIYYQFLLNY